MGGAEAVGAVSGGESDAVPASWPLCWAGPGVSSATGWWAYSSRGGTGRCAWCSPRCTCSDTPISGDSSPLHQAETRGSDASPFGTNHGAEPLGAFEGVGEVHPAAVLAGQLGLLLLLCRGPTAETGRRRFKKQKHSRGNKILIRN